MTAPRSSRMSPPVVQRDGVGPDGRGAHAHGAAPQRARRVDAGQDDSSGAVAHRRAVQQAHRIGDHPGPAEVVGADGEGEHRVRVADGVAMSVDAEGRELVAPYAMLVHVAPHEQRVESHEREPLPSLVVAIGRHGERRGHLGRRAVRHLLDAHHGNHIGGAAPHRHAPEAQRRGA